MDVKFVPNANSSGDIIIREIEVFFKKLKCHEICNFADKRPKNNKIEDYYDTLVKMIKNYKEEYFSCFDIGSKGYLKDFDLTDSTIIELAKDGCLVVTADKDLAEFLFSKKLDVINWNKIKDKILSEYKQQ